MIRRFYLRICRTYSRLFVRDRPADLIMRGLCSLFFRQTHGYWPRFRNPRSFTEKVWHRMFFDRNPLWTLFSDKWRIRQYVAERVGTDCLIPLLWHGTDPEDIPFDLLPSRFVIKATHGCQYNIIVQNKNQISRAEVIVQLRKWLKTNYATEVYLGVQWGYKNVKPSIIIEKFIGSNGIVPWDYKIFCFSGRVHFVKVHIDRYGGQSTIVMDRDFNPVDLQIGPLPPHADLERPENHQELVRVAEVLAEGLDFIRVDLYAVEGHIYFGELTCYHGGGCARFRKREDDFALGERWLISSNPNETAWHRPWG